MYNTYNSSDLMFYSNSYVIYYWLINLTFELLIRHVH